MVRRVHIFVLALLSVGPAGPAPADEATSKPTTGTLFDAQAYLAHIKYLASDELGGRLTGTPGIELAAEYIAGKFKEAGLQPAGDDGTWFQKFEVQRGKKLVETAASLKVVGIDRAWEVRQDWIPLPFTSMEDVEGPLAFAGYGIQAPRYDYDDYAGFDAIGKVLLMFRYEPPADDPNADFGGKTPSRHALFVRKVQMAAKHGAKAVLIVNPPRRQPKEDTLYAFEDYFTEQTFDLPIVHVKQELAEVLLAKAGLEKLEALQEKLDRERKPRSADMNLTIHLRTGVQPNLVSARNVIGLLKGAGGSDETIVIGAHYDHLGRVPTQWGGSDVTPQIHNGADDNASGTAGVIELARVLGREPGLRRNLLFIAFSAEELGLLGSEHFVNHPTVSLDNIRAMINLDMIGRLSADKFTIYGVHSGKEFRELVSRVAEPAGLKYSAPVGGEFFGSSDHASFYEHGIPVLFAFTGIHKEYHQPGDDWELIDAEGAVRILGMFHQIIGELANLPAGPTFQQVPADEGAAEQPPIKPAVEHAKEVLEAESKADNSSGGEVEKPKRPQMRLGIIPDFSSTGKPGVGVGRVMDGGAAQAAGLREGDRIIRIGEQQIKNIYGYMEVMRECHPGQTLEVVVVRQDEEVRLKVTLQEPPKPRGQE